MRIYWGCFERLIGASIIIVVLVDILSEKHAELRMAALYGTGDSMSSF